VSLVGIKRVISLALLCWSSLLAPFARGGLEVVENRPAVFGDGKRALPAHFHNPETASVEANLRFRLYQANSSTLAPAGEVLDFKKLVLGPRQTVIESLDVELPGVRGETVFKLVWFDGDTKIGATTVHAFPAELITPVKVLAGETPVGVVDPQGQFKAALGSMTVTDLKEAEDITSTDARLILVAPMPADVRPAGLTAALKRKATSGGAIVWIQPPAPRQTLPDVYVLDEGEGHIVIAAASVVERLADSPRAQLNLVRLAELATGKKKLELPAD
jgi:hypothetical protein